MATVVLQTVGAAIGGVAGGPFGAVLGRAAGAIAGSAIDQKLFSKDNVIEGPRLDNAQILTVNVGAPIPKAFGYNRLAGEIIWATRFEEVATSTPTQSSGGGGKGAGSQSISTTTEFTYFANFAVGICEGPISGIRRIWADNEELDLTKAEYRVYNGHENQLPDPLIEAKQGLGNAPAYRGIAYVVFESLPLEEYGNRIPQISFEVINSVGDLEKEIKSITVIPGATEYGYDPIFISSGGGEQPYSAQNRHVSISQTDWKASIDELQMLCPNLQSVSLVITWFGTDLRAGNCNLVPAVVDRRGPVWQVSNKNRYDAYVVSQSNGKPAFGGTPTDASILRAIADLKSRGLKVVIYPFIMMDIPQNNSLPGLYGENSQPVYPWRGVISCYPGPGAQNTADKTSEARTQLNHLSTQYILFIRHYISLAQSAAGVDGFLIGSELRGLTRVRDQNGAFPFVETLITLANEAKSSLGTNCFVTYGADWTEYFGYQPQDGSNDVLYNLDPLWASASIDAIGIDNYMPLADWRDTGDPGYNDVKSPYDVEYLQSNIAANEGFDWYYATDYDRKIGFRTPITDGQGEPWIYRYKDLISWWSLPHHERHGGVRESAKTAWVPQSKPIFLTEIGCPAIEKGANQPNVFYDPKSDQSAIPYFSSGGRDDLIQRRFIEAYYAYWKKATNNPISQVYGGRMLDVNEITPWAWDARPMPWFPLDLASWSDGENWHTGHWLTGRLGACSLQDLVIHILNEFGIADVDCKLDGYLEGYVIPAQTSAREALEPLLQFYNAYVVEEQGRIVLRQTNYSDRGNIVADDLLQENDQPQKINIRESELELPSEVIVKHASVFENYEQRATKSRRLDGGSDRQISIQLPAVISESVAIDRADKRLRQDWLSRKTCKLSISNKYFELAPGDVIAFDIQDQCQWIIDSKETGESHEIELRSHVDLPVSLSSRLISQTPFESYVTYGKPSIIMMDLPLLRSTNEGKVISYLAAYANPWAQNYAVFSSPSEDGFRQRGIVSSPATIGSLLEAVKPGPIGLLDKANNLHVQLLNNNFQSVDLLRVFNGANLIAIEAVNGEYELIQFQTAKLQQDGSWILSNLLRGQLGTEPAMNSGLPTNAKLLVLDQSIIPVELDPLEIGLVQNWRTGPARDPVNASSYEMLSHANNRRSGRMLTPVHLRSKQNSDGEIYFSWIRRSRIQADSWENAEVPLDANSELYQLNILDLQGNSKRQVSLSHRNFEYGTPERLADLGAEDTAFVFRVAQVGDNGLPGAYSTIHVTPSLQTT